MINCLIVDDEPLAQDIIENYVQAHERLHLIKKCSTAFEAFEVLHLQQVDLMFLDIKMPALNGLNFLKSLKDPPAVIFTTAFAGYAAASYDLEAVDYLLKPITIERFNKSIDRIFKSKSTFSEVEQKDYTYFKVSGRLLKIEHSDIRYAKSIKDYILVHTTNGNFITYMRMKTMCELLPEDRFLRVHRSYLVSLDYVTDVGKNMLRIAEVEIPIGGMAYRNLIRQRIK